MTIRIELRDGQWWAALDAPDCRKAQVVEPWLALEIRDRLDIAASATGAAGTPQHWRLHGDGTMYFYGSRGGIWMMKPGETPVEILPSIPAALPPALGEALEAWYTDVLTVHEDDIFDQDRDLRDAWHAYREHHRPRASGENAAGTSPVGNKENDNEHAEIGERDPGERASDPQQPAASDEGHPGVEHGRREGAGERGRASPQGSGREHLRGDGARQAAQNVGAPGTSPGTPAAREHDDMEGLGPCGGRRCWRDPDGVWIHSSKSYGSCSVRLSAQAPRRADDEAPYMGGLMQTMGNQHADARLGLTPTSHDPLWTTPAAATGAVERHEARDIERLACEWRGGKENGYVAFRQAVDVVCRERDEYRDMLNTERDRYRTLKKDRDFTYNNAQAQLTAQSAECARLREEKAEYHRKARAVLDSAHADSTAFLDRAQAAEAQVSALTARLAESVGVKEVESIVLSHIPYEAAAAKAFRELFNNSKVTR